MKGITLKTKVRFGTGQRSRKALRDGAQPEPPPPRVPRIAKLMALAIQFDQMVRGGEVADYADLARLGHVSRARITQIMNLLNLAPDVQDRLLFQPPVESGKDTITERRVRQVAAEADWETQRRRFAASSRSH